MEGFIPTGGAGSTAKVQEASGSTGIGATVSATLAATPTNGNRLIAFIAYRDVGAAITDPAGWTKHADVEGPSFDGGRMIFYSKVAGAAESPTLTINSGGSQNKRLYLAEWSGITAFQTVAEKDNDSAGNVVPGGVNLIAGPLTPSATAGVLFAGWNQSTRTPSLAVVAPFAQDYVAHVDSSGPSVGFGHRIVALFSGAYSAEMFTSEYGNYGAFLAAFTAAAGGITWVTAPDTVDEADGTSDDVDDVAIANTAGVFWRGSFDADVSIDAIRAVVGFTDNDDVSVLLIGGDEADWSDSLVTFQVDFEAAGGLTADEIELTFDPQPYRYWRLVLDTSAQDLRVFEVTLAEAAEVVPTPAGKAILELYMHDEDASRWGVATWATGPATGTEGIWSAAGWQDVTPEGVNAHIIWGSRRPSRGILAEQGPASWNVQTYDPDRILDPGNFDGPYYPQLVAGVPIRISHDSLVIRTGYVDEFHYRHKRPDYQGQMLCTDTWSLLNQAMVPADSILGNTLLERIADAINAAGIAVGGIPLPPSGPDGPTIADWVEGAAEDDPTSVGDHIRIATNEVLWVPFVQADAGLGLRSWGTPLDRGREITAANLEDLESVSHEDGLYSVVSVMPDPAGTPIIRKAAPLPRYGERVWERREPTVDPEGYAAAILAERPWPGVQYIPGAIHCFTAADVDYFGSLEIMERVTVTVAGAVSVQGRVLGGELFVEHRERDTKGAKWIFNFAIATDGATAIGLTTLVSDQSGETLLDDMTETDYLEAD